MKKMNYEDLKKVNDTLATVNIKGKDYVTVNERIRGFRMLYPEGTISTEIISLENGVVTMQTKIYDGDRLLATGFAQEKENASFINKTSFVENAETSSCGRALGMLGIGNDSGVASAEEMINALANQGQKISRNKPDMAQQAAANASMMANDLRVKAKNKGIAISSIFAVYGVERIEDMSAEMLGDAISKLDKYPNKNKKEETR